MPSNLTKSAVLIAMRIAEDEGDHAEWTVLDRLFASMATGGDADAGRRRLVAGPGRPRPVRPGPRGPGGVGRGPAGVGNAERRGARGMRGTTEVRPCDRCGDPAGYVPRTQVRPARIRAAWDEGGTRRVGEVCTRCHSAIGREKKRRAGAVAAPPHDGYRGLVVANPPRNGPN
jgi:hypothetical protein